MGIILDGPTGFYDYKVYDVGDKSIPISIPTTTKTTTKTTTNKNGGGSYPEPDLIDTIADVIPSPFPTGFFSGSDVKDFWDLLIGTGQEKAEALSDVYGKYGILGKDELQQILDDINKNITSVAGEAAEEWTEQKKSGITGQDIDIKFPELPNLKDIGKWLLIGGGILAGIYLIGKYIGRKK